MPTYQDFVYNSTPLNKHLVKKFGIIQGAVASKIVYASNLSDGVCRMGQRRKAEELGMDRSTVSKAEKYLIDEKYILVVKDATDTEPAHLKPSAKLWNLIKTVDVINPPVDKVNPPVDKVNPPVDVITQEEESEEESEEEGFPISDFELIQSAIKEACKVATSDRNKGQLYKATREAQNTGKTPEKILQFGKWYNETYWPGKYPNITQISSDWPKFEERGKTNGKSSTVILPAAQNADGSYNI